MGADKNKDKDPQPKPGRKPGQVARKRGTGMKGFPVIGIGASAGGLEAFGKLFSKMPQDTGMAFIVIQHIEPSRTGNMASLIQKYTSMPVVEAKADIKVEPNHLYFIPQNREISLVDRTLQLGEVIDSGMRHSIDLFFRSLAEDLKDRAICVVLSGTGTDGTVGAREVKAHTGLVIVQDPDDASYDGMPRSAINAGVADIIATAEEMPEKLIEYVKGAYGRPAERRRKSLETATDSLNQILSIVRSRTKRDFSGYKVSTMNRRVERRMSINRVQELEDYIRLLRESPEEVEDLTKDFLIQVTSFFRDPQVFAALEKQLKALIESKNPGEGIRVWTAGCSTGEETYSVAILVEKCLVELGRSTDFHVFGTDLDPDAIDTARTGVYPESIGADVGPERLEKYFTRKDTSYQINRRIRERVIFSVHDLISDPPFSRMDCVVARNLLIYLDSETQKQVLPVLRYALNDGGILLLGTAETIGEFGEDLFDTLDHKWRIFQARKDKSGLTPAQAFRGYAYRGIRAVPQGKAYPEVVPDADAQRALVRALPPAVLVDRNLSVLYVHGETGKYLQLGQGQLSTGLLDLARESIRMPLATAAHLALTRNQEVVREGIRVKLNGETITVKITVKPIYDRQTRLAVLFEDIREPKGKKRGKGTGAGADERYRELEHELQFTRESLKTTVEELETANEELRSTVEEYQSTNEELHSANQELETSREELQSMNEELSTVNREHKEKIDELTLVGDDMRNLLNSTSIATVFVDEDLVIKRFTPATSQMLNLRERDVGRPLTDITSRVRSTDLVGYARQVLDTLVPAEAEVETDDGRWYSVRILPYRTSGNAIDGAVITFLDINPQKELQDELRHALAYANSILDTMREPMVVLDGDMRVLSVNQAFYRVFQVSPEQTEGRLLCDLGDGQWDIPDLRRLLESVLPEDSVFEDFLVEDDFPGIGRRRIALNARRLRLTDGETARVLLAMEDITERSGPRA